MSANADETAPVGGLLNRPTLRLIVADLAQNPVPDGNQVRTVKASDLFKQIREEAGITPYPQNSDTWDVAAHPRIFITLTADTNLLTINDEEPGLECEVEVIQNATGNHRLVINGIEMAVAGRGHSLITGRRFQDALRFNDTSILAGSLPEIIEQPQGTTATIGTTAAFRARARNWTGVALLKNGMVIPDVQGTAYQVAISFESKGAYQFKFINRYGFTLTDAANIDSIESDVPTILSQPTDQTLDEGSGFSLPFVVSGPSLVYRVFKNNLLIATISANTYTKTTAKTTDSGVYRIEAGNALGQVVSNTVTVTVNSIILPVPVISFTQPLDMTVGAVDQMLIVSSTNVVTTVVLTSVDPSVAIVTGSGKLKIVAPGTVDIIASQAAGNGYQAAVSVTRTVTMIAQPTPVITFMQPTNMTMGDADQALVVGSTNAVTPVVLTSSNINVAAIVNGKLRIQSSGTAQITASQTAGNGHQVAQPVSWTVTFLAQQAAVITFNQPQNMTVGDADQTLLATSTNTVIPITFSTSDSSKATIVNGKLRIIASGTFSVFADQAAGNGYLAAVRVSKSISSFATVTPSKVLIRISGDSFVRNIGGTGVGSSQSGSGPGLMSITNQINARLKQQVTSNVQFVVTDDGGAPGQTASWFANNENNNGRLQAVKDYFASNISGYDKGISISIYGTNDESALNVNNTSSVDAIINNLHNANSQIKSVSDKIVVVGYPITMRKDLYSQPNTNAFRNSFNSRIAADPSIINANAVGKYALYPEIYSDSAPDDNRYFAVNDSDNLSKVHPTDLGYYRIAEMIAQRIAVLCNISLTTDGDPIIYQQPSSQNLSSGQTLNLSVIAMGIGVTYQWKKDINNVLGATGSNYSKANVSINDSANYTVVVANNIRSVTSNSASIMVESPPSVSLLSSLPAGLDYLASITADGNGVNEVASQGSLISFSGRGTPTKVNNAINGKAAYKFVGTNPDGFKLTLTNVQSTIMVAVTVRIDSRDSGKESVILSLPFNQSGFNLNNNYGDGRTIAGVQGIEVGGPFVNAGLLTGELATFVFFTDGGIAKVRFKGTTYGPSGAGAFTTLQSNLNDFLVGGKTDVLYPSPFDGILGGMVIANGNVSEANVILIETALNNYYKL